MDLCILTEMPYCICTAIDLRTGRDETFITNGVRDCVLRDLMLKDIPEVMELLKKKTASNPESMATLNKGPSQFNNEQMQSLLVAAGKAHAVFQMDKAEALRSYRALSQITFRPRAMMTVELMKNEGEHNEPLPGFNKFLIDSASDSGFPLFNDAAEGNLTNFIKELDDFFVEYECAYETAVLSTEFVTSALAHCNKPVHKVSKWTELRAMYDSGQLLKVTPVATEFLHRIKPSVN